MRTQISEARRAADDGYFWPVSRGAMCKPKDIRDRMVADIAELVNKDGEDAVVTSDDLVRKGWTSTQLEHHGKGAFDLFNARRDAKEQAAAAASEIRKRDSGGRFAVQAAMLAIIYVPTLVVVGHLSGKF